MNVTMEDKVRAAARRTAINLMRLSEAVELADAEQYSTIRNGPNHPAPRTHRIGEIKSYYEDWFTNVAGGLEQGRPRQRGPANPAAEGSDPSEAKENTERTR